MTPRDTLVNLPPYNMGEKTHITKENVYFYKFRAEIRWPFIVPILVKGEFTILKAENFPQYD